MFKRTIIPGIIILLLSAIYPFILVNYQNGSKIDAFSTCVITFAVLIILYRINFTKGRY